MLGATQAVLLGAAGCPAAGYAATVTGIPGLLAYWRLSDASGIVDETAGNRNGIYDGTVSLVAGLPVDSDQATLFPGTVVGTVPNDSGLALAAGSVSLWVRPDAFPADRVPVFSKDQSGIFDADFAMTLANDGELGIQFQQTSGSQQHFVTASVPIETGEVVHLCATWDGTGFSFWINGKLVGKNTAWTGGWTSNSNAIQFASAPWTSNIFEGVLDECAIYSRVLTDAEIITLAQRDGVAPIAAATSAVVQEENIVEIDVAAISSWIGRKGDLTVAVIAQGSFGTASVNGSNNIEFDADAVTEDEADSFTYRITDANGQSNTATVSMTVQDAVSAGEGTLVYDWSPLASWIDGVALSSRDADNVRELARWTNPSAATVGSSLPKAVEATGGQSRYCFNYAPDGTPALEIYTAAGDSGPANFSVRLYDELGAGSGPWPRHLRVVMEIKLSHPDDPTTHKSSGLGSTTGSYPNWHATHASGGSHTSGKYFLGSYAGAHVAGAGAANWWGDHNDPIDRAGFRVAWGTSSKYYRPYIYHFDRPGTFGNVSGGFDTVRIVDTNDWHRVELETFLTDPATVPSNAQRSSPEVEPDHTGDGFAKVYVTLDVDDGGTRQLVSDLHDLIYFCKTDNVGDFQNMHQLANLAGFWICLIYGGSTSAFNPGWAWIRNIKVYRLD